MERLHAHALVGVSRGDAQRCEGGGPGGGVARDLGGAHPQELGCEGAVLGSLDGDGYLTITGRKKELIVTAGGKNISPAPIEAALKRSPLVAEAVLIGDRQPYCAALLIPDFPALAARTQAEDASREALVERPEVVRLFDTIVEDANAELAPHEQVKRFALLPAEFAIATGELTPTMKVKRNVVCDRWADTIERLYAG